jgi:hypothetical protein
MKVIWILVLSTFAGFLLPVRALAQDKRFESVTPTALEKQLYELELKWMKAEHDKKLDGPDSMGEMWMDTFFDVLPTGRGCRQARNDGHDEQGRCQAGYRRLS